MRSVLSEFFTIWPGIKIDTVASILVKVPFFYFPEEKELLEKCVSPRSFVVVAKGGSVQDLIYIMSLGFEHVVQRDRSDFASELLVSCLMILRPAAFVRNPVPFFFNGFQDPKKVQATEKNLDLTFQKSSDKNYLLDRLIAFLDQNERLAGLTDICVQVADELITNALFSAPILPTGKRLYHDLERSSEVTLPESHRARFFACYSNDRVVIGCEDLYGSFKRQPLMSHLGRLFGQEKSTHRDGVAGAGLGFKYMVENAAGFYLFSDFEKRSLVACAFLLKGLKANFSSDKHLHISAR